MRGTAVFSLGYGHHRAGSGTENHFVVKSRIRVIGEKELRQVLGSADVANHKSKIGNRKSKMA